MFELKGKNAIITGGIRGIGFEVARVLANVEEALQKAPMY